MNYNRRSPPCNHKYPFYQWQSNNNDFLLDDFFMVLYSWLICIEIHGSFNSILINLAAIYTHTWKTSTITIIYNCMPKSQCHLHFLSYLSMKLSINCSPEYWFQIGTRFFRTNIYKSNPNPGRVYILGHGFGKIPSRISSIMKLMNPQKLSRWAHISSIQVLLGLLEKQSPSQPIYTLSHPLQSHSKLIDTQKMSKQPFHLFAIR